MPFSLGIGDVIATGSLVLSLTSALEEANGSSADYQSLMKELYAFHRALMEVVQLTKKSELPQAFTNSLIMMVTNSREPIERFLSEIDKYRRSLQSRGSGNWVQDTLRKFGWATLKANNVQRLRNHLQGLSMSIQILLQVSGR